jgi:hypothetical protein
LRQWLCLVFLFSLTAPPPGSLSVSFHRLVPAVYLDWRRNRRQFASVAAFSLSVFLPPFIPAFGFLFSCWRGENSFCPPLPCPSHVSKIKRRLFESLEAEGVLTAEDPVDLGCLHRTFRPLLQTACAEMAERTNMRRKDGYNGSPLFLFENRRAPGTQITRKLHFRRVLTFWADLPNDQLLPRPWCEMSPCFSHVVLLTPTVAVCSGSSRPPRAHCCRYFEQYNREGGGLQASTSPIVDVVSAEDRAVINAELGRTAAMESLFAVLSPPLWFVACSFADARYAALQRSSLSDQRIITAQRYRDDRLMTRALFGLTHDPVTRRFRMCDSKC